MSVKAKMTAIADKIRSILGVSGVMGLDAMATNLDTCTTAVNTQSDLLDYALEIISDKAAGGIIPADPVLQSKDITPSENEQNVTPDAGYDGLSSVFVEAIDSRYIGSDVPRLGVETYTPKATDQIITSGQYLTGTQTILGDADLIAENIKDGISIFGITGTCVPESSSSGYDTSDADAEASDIASEKVAYNNNGRVVGNLEIIQSNTQRFEDDNYVTIANFGTTPYLVSKATMSRKLIWDKGSVVGIRKEATCLGDAKPSDVKSGVTFSSSNGILQIGEKVDPPGLPAGISKIATGTFTLSSDKSDYYSITHNLGVVPNFINVVATGNIIDTSFINYVIQHYSYAIYVGMLDGAMGSDIQNISIVGKSGGFVESKWCGTQLATFNSSRADVYFGEGAKLKAGVTYRWICGVTEF